MTAARVRLLFAHAVLHAHFQSSPAVEDPLENLTKPNNFRQSSHGYIAATGRTDIFGTSGDFNAGVNKTLFVKKTFLSPCGR